MLWHEGGAGSKAVPATSGVNVSCNLQHATHFHGFCMKNQRTTTINLNSTCEQNFKVYSHAAYLLQKFPLHRSYRNACMCCRKRLIQCMEWKFQEHICHVWIYFDFLGFVHTTLFSVGKIGYGSTTIASFNGGQALSGLLVAVSDVQSASISDRSLPPARSADFISTSEKNQCHS